MQVDTPFVTGFFAQVVLVTLSNGTVFKLFDDNTGFLHISVQEGIITSRPLSTQMLRLAQEPHQE